MSAGLYCGSLSLLTDLYQLTMAAAAFRTGVAHREAVFHLTFRRSPFQGGFTLAAGLGPALDFIRTFHFTADDCEYLGTLEGAGGVPLFDRPFLDWLQKLDTRIDVDAVPEGTVVFPQEPLLRVQGPIVPCMLLETPLLTLMNFQTLIATKGARVTLAAQGDPVLEFGLRRAQGIDGALAASRAAYVGGVAATSNVLAGKLLGIPVKGTHAHSWVMAYGDELEAFDEYARAMPHNVVFLVDTYDSLEGVRHAIEAGKRLRARGHDLLGIRLDSGDLAWLSIQARRMLDDAGFTKAQILASNDLDETLIESLKIQGAKITTWGVGTKLVTGYDEPALGGVYKLAAVREPGGRWSPRIKISEQSAKTSIPGQLQIRRYVVDGEMRGDLIYDVEDGVKTPTLIDPFDITRRKTMAPGTPHEELLVPAVRGGQVVYVQPPLDAIRERTRAQLAMLNPAVKRFVNPHKYPVGLEPTLYDRRTQMILDARGGK